MTMMEFADQQEDKEHFCVGWLPDGKSFVVRNADEFTRHLIPNFFKPTKFSSFTRKLYRWGFRQVNRGIGPDDPVIFGNDDFQRDSKELMARMRSTTAVGIRKKDEFVLGKRPADDSFSDADRKRYLMGWKDMPPGAMFGFPPQAFHPSMAMTMNPMLFQQQQQQQALWQNMQKQPQEQQQQPQQQQQNFPPQMQPMAMPPMMYGMPMQMAMVAPTSPTAQGQQQQQGSDSQQQAPSLAASLPSGSYPSAQQAEIMNAAMEAMRQAK
jgi:hypothetical protein